MELSSQFPYPKMIEGFTITAFRPSWIPLQTSFSALYFDMEYPLVFSVKIHLPFSVISTFDGISFLPTAEVELTWQNLSTFFDKATFTILAVPYRLISINEEKSLRAKDTNPAQW